ncbi:sortase [bacterium]|nr:sortase [bacterium]
MGEEKSKRFGITGIIMMLVGSLMFGIIIAKAVEEYKQDHFVLDQVDVKSPQSASSENLPAVFLDLSEQNIDTLSEDQTQAEVQAHVEDIYAEDEEGKSTHYSRIPTRIQIPAVSLDTKIGFATLRDVEVNGEDYQQWVAPDFIAGWHYTSAVLGDPGNTVINGHHNINGEVFKNLHLVQKGDDVIISSEAGRFYYKVAAIMILPEKYQSEEVRLQNARWIQQSDDERITLITCWPYESNTHRVVVVAFPINKIDP